jgi:peptidoglycan/LPS O-acetylase OafA/YrhL
MLGELIFIIFTLLMSPSQLETSPILATVYAVVLYGVMWAIAAWYTKLPQVAANITKGQGRYGSLDGLRGVLATAVLVIHTFTVYQYFLTGEWVWSQSAVFNHLGQTGVAMFFMITGFLFTLKAMSSKIDWQAFYLARIARLFPLYCLVVVVLFGLVMLLSGGVLQEPIWIILKEFVQWLSCMWLGRPDVNNFPLTWTIIAGVNWSLKFELLFYVLAFPLLHLVAKFFPAKRLLWLSGGLLASLLALAFYKGLSEGNLLYTMHFLCGIVVAYAYQEPRWLQLMQGKVFQLVAGLSVLGLFWLPNAFNSISVIISLVFFAAVVGGLSIFGLLKTPAALWLGDISYGIYLLHGMVLWLTVFACKSFGSLTQIGMIEYGLLMGLVGAVVVSLASISYVYLEKPVMFMVRPRKAVQLKQI